MTMTLTTTEIQETLHQRVHEAQSGASEEARAALLRSIALKELCDTNTERCLLTTMVLHEMPGLTDQELATLARSVHYGRALKRKPDSFKVPEEESSDYLQALIDHPGAGPETLVALFHDRDREDPAEYCSAYWDEDRLDIAVARRTSKPWTVTVNSTIRFINHMNKIAPENVRTTLAHMLGVGNWEGSLLDAYYTACAIEDEPEHKTQSAVICPGWIEPLTHAR